MVLPVSVSYWPDNALIHTSYSYNDLSDEQLAKPSLPKYVEDEEDLNRETGTLEEPEEPWMIGYNEH